MHLTRLCKQCEQNKSCSVSWSHRSFGVSAFVRPIMEFHRKRFKFSTVNQTWCPCFEQPAVSCLFVYTTVAIKKVVFDRLLTGKQRPIW